MQPERASGVPAVLHCQAETADAQQPGDEHRQGRSAFGAPATRGEGGMPAAPPSGRTSRHQLVKASGLRWISLMRLGYIRWAGRYWALPVLTVPAPSYRYHQQQGRRHKKITDGARQMVMQLRRWIPQRKLVLGGGNGYAVLDLLHCCQSLREPVTLIARLRLDAALYAPAPPRQPGQDGRPALKALREPELKTLLDQADAT